MASPVNSSPLAIGVSKMISQISRTVNIPNKPQKTFGSSVFLRLQFVQNEGLQRLGFGGGSIITLAEFLKDNVRVHKQSLQGVKTEKGSEEDNVP